MTVSFSAFERSVLSDASQAASVVFPHPRWGDAAERIPTNRDAEAHALLDRARNDASTWERHELRLLQMALAIMASTLDAQRQPEWWSDVDDPALVETLVEARQDAYEDVVTAQAMLAGADGDDGYGV